MIGGTIDRLNDALDRLGEQVELFVLRHERRNDILDALIEEEPEYEPFSEEMKEAIAKRKWVLSNE